MENLKEQISRAEEAGRFEREFSLPAALGEDKLSYTLNDGPPPFFTLAGLGVLGAVVMSVKEKTICKKREKPPQPDASGLFGGIITADHFSGGGDEYSQRLGTDLRGVQAGRGAGRPYREIYL